MGSPSSSAAAYEEKLVQRACRAARKSEAEAVRQLKEHDKDVHTRAWSVQGWVDSLPLAALVQEGLTRVVDNVRGVVVSEQAQRGEAPTCAHNGPDGSRLKFHYLAELGQMEPAEGVRTMRWLLDGSARDAAQGQAGATDDGAGGCGSVCSEHANAAGEPASTVAKLARQLWDGASQLRRNGLPEETEEASSLDVLVSAGWLQPTSRACPFCNVHARPACPLFEPHSGSCMSWATCCSRN